MKRIVFSMIVLFLAAVSNHSWGRSISFNLSKCTSLTDDSLHNKVDSSYSSKIVSNGLDIVDVRCRMEIIKEIDKFFYYFETKNIEAIESMLSNTVIYTDSVKHSAHFSNHDKENFLSKLRTIFMKESVKCEIEDLKIQRHGPKPAFYGVSCILRCSTSNYNMDGYVFLLYDFTNENNPKIHIATWQPYESTKPDEIFNIHDFMF